MLPTIKIFISLLYHAKDATQGEGGVFVVANGDGIDTHLDNRVIVAAGLGHVTKVEDVFFSDF